MTIDFLYGVLMQSRCIEDAKLIDDFLQYHSV